MNVWIIAADAAIGNLIDAANAIGDTVTVLTIGDVDVHGVHKVINLPLPAGYPAEAMAPVVAGAMTGEPGTIVLVPNRSTERVIAGAVAARLALPVLTGVTSIAAGRAEIVRYGGISTETVAFESVVAVMDGGAPLEGDSAEVVSAPDVELPFTVAVTNVATEEVSQANLVAASRIVVAGTAFAEKDDLSIAQELADAIDGELACTRPLAEGKGWMARDRYIGVSGQIVAPDLYIGAGVSGQIHHTAGMDQSGVVVAINEDENAPIFEIADYGILGDVYTVLPQLTAALNEAK